MDLNKQDLLILDEVGYVPITKDGSEMLFRIVSDSYEAQEPHPDDQSGILQMGKHLHG